MTQGFIYDQYGNHASKHQDVGEDEISVTGLSGLLADDQHVLDAEVTAVAIPKSLVTTAGDLIYATAAATLARLGITADKKLFGNAGGTAPEWVTGIKIGTFTHDTSILDTTTDYAGIGFKPSHVVFLASIIGTPQASIGFGDGTNYFALHNFHNEVADTWAMSVSHSIRFNQSSTIRCYGKITTLGADGFTITWTRDAGKTGTAVIAYMAFR